MAGRTLEEVKQGIRAGLAMALEKAREAGELSFGSLPPLELEVPQRKEHGDYSSNAALLLAREAGRPPREVAEAILRHFGCEGTWVERAEVAGPGFINFFLNPGWLYRTLEVIAAGGAGYGRSDYGRGRKVQVEFVSANPTGPLVVVGARAGAVGDALANLLDAAGYRVQREYYINDAGHQVAVLGRSLEIRFRQLLGEDIPLPEDAYPGEYLVEVARELLAERGPGFLQPEEGRLERFSGYAVERMLRDIRRELDDYGVRFDVWFSEASLHRAGALREVLDLLRAGGYVYEREGALWLRTTLFGDDKDRVLVKADGEATYFLADIAYHRDKFRRGFEKVIDIWGPDHHGYIPRMQAAMRALGYPEGSLEVLIVQMVRLFKEGSPVRMSKRAGDIVLMADLLEEVGRDAARFFFLMRTPESHLDFDLDLARLQSNENPVYYVQYAHARACSILRQAAAEGVTVPDPRRIDLAVLKEEVELDLIRKLAELPEEIISAAESRQPHHLTRYLQELATVFHSFYTRCRVLGPDAALTAARLAVVDATRVVLRNALALLGVSAPDRM